MVNASKFSKILFERHGDPGWLPLGIFTANPDGRDCMQIRATSTGAAPEWSPDGRWIAFHEVPEGNESYASNIFIMKPDGAGGKQITFHSDAAAACPTWSPDSTKIVYSVWKDQAHQIWVVGIEGSRPKQITFTGSNGYPVWAPSNEIVFQREAQKMFVMDSDGHNQRECFLFQAGDQEPVWSRDGLKVCFIRNAAICVMNADGGGFLQLPGASGIIEVSWSPDSESIVYTRSELTSGQEVYVCDIKGENHLKIIENPFGPNNKEVGSCDVCWSPWLHAQERYLKEERKRGGFLKRLFG
jgi:Tol biopolymer transport system component